MQPSHLLSSAKLCRAILRFGRTKRSFIVVLSAFFLIVLGMKLPATTTEFKKPKARPRAVISQVAKSICQSCKQGVAKFKLLACIADPPPLTHPSPLTTEHIPDSSGTTLAVACLTSGNRSPPSPLLTANL